MSNRLPSRKPHAPAGQKQAGFTLIELMVACALLVFGIMAMAGLVGLSIKNNGHSRLDSTATMLNQAVVEQVSTGVNYVSYGGTGTAFFRDCNNKDWPIDSLGPGANLKNGNIDFLEDKNDPNLKGYQMDYVVCNGGKKVTYDVRWNITELAPPPSSITSFTHILTVGTQMEGGAAGAAGIINFPINMRVMVGPDPLRGR